MTPRFNLVDAPWIPCLLAADGPPQELGLRGVLVQAPAIREISHPSPLVTVALHRLLLAILHRHVARGYGPTSEAEWAELWQRGAFDAAAIDDYLTRWSRRFELFDAERPFYQVGTLDLQHEWPITELTHELASSGNAATLFDHTTEIALSPAQAARYLIAFHSFAYVNFVRHHKHEDQKLYKSADAAPLVKAAVGLVKGTNLFETLLLNLVCYDPEQDEPFAYEGDDRPAWERDEETRAEDRWPSGYLDLLTWQSRRLLLRPEVGADGVVRVPAVVVMKGYQFPDRFHRRRRETMLAFVGKPRAKAGEDPWPAVSFQEERSLWRDSLALFQSVAHEQPKAEEPDRPQTVSWLARLADCGVLETSLVVPMEFFGVSTARATIHFWRHERLPLPLAYLRDEKLVADLSTALTFAEEVARALRCAVHDLAKLLLAPSAGQANAREPTGKVIGPLVRSLAPERRYWPRLEEAFAALLVGLAQPPPGESAEQHRRRALAGWQETVLAAARRAFAELTRSLDTSARSLKAAAAGERALHRHLRPVIKERGIPAEEEDASESTERS